MRIHYSMFTINNSHHSTLVKTNEQSIHHAIGALIFIVFAHLLTDSPTAAPCHCELEWDCRIQILYSGQLDIGIGPSANYFNWCQC